MSVRFCPLLRHNRRAEILLGNITKLDYADFTNWESISNIFLRSKKSPIIRQASSYIFSELFFMPPLLFQTMNIRYTIPDNPSHRTMENGQWQRQPRSLQQDGVSPRSPGTLTPSILHPHHRRWHTSVHLSHRVR